MRRPIQQDRHPRAPGRWLITLFAMAILALPAAAAGGAGPDAGPGSLRDLPRLVKESREILEGVVVEIESQFEEEDLGQGPSESIYTYVTLMSRDTLKGDGREATRTLRIRGGCVNDHCVISPQMPRFQRDDEAFVFLKGEDDEGSSICPVVGLRRGVFHIQRDGNGDQVVDRGRRVSRRENGPSEALSVKRIQESDRYSDDLSSMGGDESLAGHGREPVRRLSRAEFVDALRAEIARQGSEDRSAGMGARSGKEGRR